MKPLQGIVVVEYSGSVAGAYCAKQFVDQGATVHLVGERRLPLHQQLYFDAGKILADGDRAIDLRAVDVVIESSAPGPLAPRALDAPQAIRVGISPFGTSGPYAQWSATDLVDYAISGHSYLYGDPDREPLRGPPDQPAIAAGLFGFVGAMAGLLARDRLGSGQIVDVSHMQVMVALHQITLLRWSMTGDVFCRMGNRYTGQGQPNGPYPCADGWIAITAVAQQQVESLLAVTGLTGLLDHPSITGPMDFQSHPEVIDGPLTEWLSDQRVDDVVELFQALRIPTAPLLDMAQLLTDPQLADRGFFGPLEGHADVLAPGRPFTMSHLQAAAGNGWQPGDLGAGPLAGLRVLDLARVWAGPLCARILSDLGAEVVWVEAPWSRGPKEIPQSMIDAMRYFPNDDPGERPWNRNGHFVKYALGKKSLAIDLQTAAGQAAFERIVPGYHVLLENFSTRVMPQLGFDEQRLHELNPDLIYLTMPGYGRSGPAENWLAYGSCIDSHAGLSSLNGYRDQVPWKGGIAWPDPIAGLHAAVAVLSALWAQLGGAGGLTIEAAQFESTVAAIGDRIIEAQIDRPYSPDGNRDPGVVAQGIYPTLGGDCWIAISVPDPTALADLAELVGTELDSADHDQIDALVSAWTSGHHASELTRRLQQSGIPAGPVTKAPDIMNDEHLASRRAWVTVDQPDIGVFVAPITPIGLSATPVAVRAAAPTLGEDNLAVLAQAGFDGQEIAALAATGIIATAPPS